MDALFLNVITLSLTCSLVLLPALLCSRLLSRRYTARTLSVLWLLLAVRMVLPVQIPLPRAPVVFTAPVYTLRLPAGGAVPAAGVAAQAEAVRSVGLTEVLSAVWVAGMVLFLSYQFGAYLWTRRRLLKNAQPMKMPPGEIPDRVTPVRSPLADAPMMLGLLRPVLALPVGELDADTLGVVLRHELCHLRRRDVAYKTVLLLANAVHWFNPLVWLMAREASRNLELCCDDDVLRGADRAERRAYGQVLLAAASPGRATVCSTRFGSPKGEMKERLANLFAQKKRGILPVLALVLAAVAMGLAVTLQPAADDTLYRNKAHDFTLQLPQSWAGRYTVTDHGTEIEFFQKNHGNNSGKFMSLCIEPTQELTERLGVPDAQIDRVSPVPVIFLGRTGRYSVYLRFVSDVNFDMGNRVIAAEYQEMDHAVRRLTPADYTPGTPAGSEGGEMPPDNFTANDSAENTVRAREKQMGVNFPQIDYVSADLLVFHDYWGLAVYDFRQGQIVRLADTTSIGMNLIQGDQYTEVVVAESLDRVYFYNTPREKPEDAAWIYFLKDDALWQTTVGQVSEEPRAVSTSVEGEFFFQEGAEPVIKDLSYRSTGGKEYRVFDSAEWAWPVEGHYTITSTCGARIHPVTGLGTEHSGTDIQAPEGIEIRAARGGAVSEAGFDKGWGNYVKISHGDALETLYSQMASYTVEVGDSVEKGQLIGYVGSTGSATGPHLHFEVRVDGVCGDALEHYPALSFAFK